MIFANINQEVTLKVYNKDAFNELCNKDLVWTSKEGSYKINNFCMFEDEMSYLKDDLYMEGYTMAIVFKDDNTRLVFEVMDDKDNIICSYTVKCIFEHV